MPWKSRVNCNVRWERLTVGSKWSGSRSFGYICVKNIAIWAVDTSTTKLGARTGKRVTFGLQEWLCFVTFYKILIQSKSYIWTKMMSVEPVYQAGKEQSARTLGNDVDRKYCHLSATVFVPIW